jgi:hypothetical protein
MELLQTPRPALVSDVSASERTSREGLLRAAHSYFDALEGDSGKIGAFADDCVRHEVEVFPFVVLPYGSNNGWPPGAGR